MKGLSRFSGFSRFSVFPRFLPFLLIAAFTVVASGWTTLPAISAQPTVTITYLSYVGNKSVGTATLLQGNGQTVLVDASPSAASGLMRALTALGVTRIDVLILTHPHDDHFMGARELTVPVVQVWTNGDQAYRGDSITTYPATLASLASQGATFTVLRQGMHLPLLVGSFDVYNPVDTLAPRANYTLGSGDTNANALAARWTYGQFGLLIASDMMWWSDRYITWPQTPVIEWPHHGGSDAGSTHYFDQTHPSYILVRNTTLATPLAYQVQQAQQYGARVLTTETGPITITTDGVAYSVAQQSIPVCSIPPAGNLIPNGDFAQGLVGFDIHTDAGMEGGQVTVQTYKGAPALKSTIIYFTGDFANPGLVWLFTSPSVPVIPGHTYNFSACGMADNGSSTMLILRITWRDANGIASMGEWDGQAGGVGYPVQIAQPNLVAPAGAVAVRVDINTTTTGPAPWADALWLWVAMVDVTP